MAEVPRSINLCARFAPDLIHGTETAWNVQSTSGLTQEDHLQISCS